MNKITFTDNKNGTIVSYEKIPHGMFTFYVLRKRDYKNETSLWHLCVEIAAAPTGKQSPKCVGMSLNYIKLESFKGTKEQAVERLDAIIEEYKQ